jgi:RNA polymerase sigma-70 factor, ECF subfamily
LAQAILENVVCVSEFRERETVSDEAAQLDDRDRADMIRLATGHGPALNALMERHAGRLFHYLVRCLQNEEDAADVAQETFVRVYQNCAKFDTRMKFSTWLYAIATNLVKDRYRHRSRHPQVSLDAENEAMGENFRENMPAQNATPSESLQASERAETIRKAVTKLPEELRAPLILCEYEELSHAEIGKILDCTPKAVETRIYRARNQLRDKLGWLFETR